MGEEREGLEKIKEAEKGELIRICDPIYSFVSASVGLFNRKKIMRLTADSY